MGGRELLGHILDRLLASEHRSALFGADEIDTWQPGSFDALLGAGIFVPAPPARVVECHGCEQNCFMQVELQLSEGTSTPRATIYCDKTANIGPVPVALRRLNRWCVTDEGLANTMTRVLGSSVPPVRNPDGASWTISLANRKNQQDTLTLTFREAVELGSSSRVVPLTEVLALTGSSLSAEPRAVRHLLQNERVQPRAGVGSRKWRSEKARKAADTRHNQPGGSRDKIKKLLDAWDSGKYPSRNQCAEHESKRLGISVATARRALQNTPGPSRKP